MIDFECRGCHEPLSVPSSLAGDFTDCPECGVSNRVPRGTAIVAATEIIDVTPVATAATPPVKPPRAALGVGSCPACGCENTQRVQMIWETQSKNTASQSLLAGRMGPPRPASESLAWLGMAAVAGVAAVFFLSYAIARTHGITAVCGVVMLAAVFGCIVAQVRTGKQVQRHNRTVYGPAMMVWRSQWCCLRCGKVFIPS